MKPLSAAEAGVTLEDSVAVDSLHRLHKDSATSESTNMYAGCVHRYVSDGPPVIDPYAAAALRASSRPISPQVAPGGWRVPAALQTAESSARWAAAALRGRALPGSAVTASHGAGKDTGIE